MRPDVVVIGGGTVGAAIAYGLAGRRQRVLLLDGDDGDFRAARANFGLVWLQGKGVDMPAYQQLTRDSIALWSDFRTELTEQTGIDLQYEQNGGLSFCFGDEFLETRRLQLQRLHNQWGGSAPDWEILDRAGLQRLLPKMKLGPDVSGASLGHRDGHANPLRLLMALHAGLIRRGGELRSGAAVRTIAAAGDDLRIGFGDEELTTPKLVIAAGLGSPALARQVGLDIPLRPQRGQVLVTEKLEPFMPLPASGLRQTGDGTVMIGATQEETGYDVSTTGEAAAHLSHKTIRVAPALADVTLVRQWAGLRILTPDSYPVYTQSPSHPGAFVALCHSGVTLAAVHAASIADAVAAGALPAALDPFHQRRFDVQKAA